MSFSPQIFERLLRMHHALITPPLDMEGPRGAGASGSVTKNDASTAELTAPGAAEG